MAIPKLGAVIAIDGPAGTGKSSATHLLCERLGFVHVDTGALYRAIGLVSLEMKADTAQTIEIAKKAHLEFKRDPSKKPANRIRINGRDVTDFIRTPEVSMAASKVSAIPEVRLALLSLQRRLGCAGPSILEGRDIGTIIFPDADVKFFLTASIEERARRRMLELQAKGQKATLAEVTSQIALRDEGDSTRAVAPLRKAADAIEMDTSEMNLEQVVAKMETEARKKLGIR